MPYKVMIVDDEMIVRKGIMTSIDWPEHGIEIIAEAKHGEDALAQLAECPVDLVLTDIRMPVMSGIELARRVKTQYPETEVVMLSGYEDFQYAKEAMAIGIRHYLLKPVMADKLVATLSQLRDQQQARRLIEQGERIKNTIFNENLPSIKSRLMSSLMDQRSDAVAIAEQARSLHLHLQGPSYQIFQAEIDDFVHLTECLSPKEREAYTFAVSNVAEETLQSHFPGFVCHGEPGRLVGVANMEYGQSAVPVCEEIRSNLGQYLKLSISIGIGQPVATLADVSKSYREAVWAVGQKVFLGKGKIHTYRGENERPSAAIPIALREQEKQLLRCLQSLDMDGMRRAVNLYFSCCNGEQVSYEAIKGSCIRLTISLMRAMEEKELNTGGVFPDGFLPHIEARKLEVVADLEAWIKQLVERIIERIEENGKPNSTRLVKETIRFICQHYGEQLALSDLARHVQVTPPHLSKVFKEEMGVTFVKWLNQFRMEEAKTLLRSSWLKTYEIAEKVGYPDYKYFSLLFKQHTGCSPREYRNQ